MRERLCHEAAEGPSDREAGWALSILALDGAGAKHPGSSDNDPDNVGVVSGWPRTAPGGPSRQGRGRRRNPPATMSLTLSLVEGGLAEAESGSTARQGEAGRAHRHAGPRKPQADTRIFRSIRGSTRRGGMQSGSSVRDDGPVPGRVSGARSPPRRPGGRGSCTGHATRVEHPELDETHGTSKLLFDALLGRGGERPRA